MSDIEPMTPEALSQYIGGYIGKEWAEYFERLHAQLAELKRQEKNCGDDRDYWFKRAKELKAHLSAVTTERDELEVDLFNALAQLGAVRKEISDLRAYIAVYAKPLVTPND